MTNKVIELKTVVASGKGKSRKRGPNRRPAWSGMLNESELALPGGVLLAMLLGRASEIGQQHTDMAAELGVTYGYIAQLRSGLRKTEHISDQFANACALYLGVPRMTVLLAANRVQRTDLFEDEHEMLRSLPRALRYMQGDPQYGPLMPHDVLTARKELQLFIVTLYEKARGRTLLPGRHSAEDVAAKIARYVEDRERLAKTVEADKAAKAARRASEK